MNNMGPKKDSERSDESRREVPSMIWESRVMTISSWILLLIGACLTGLCYFLVEGYEARYMWASTIMGLFEFPIAGIALVQFLHGFKAYRPEEAVWVYTNLIYPFAVFPAPLILAWLVAAISGL